MKTDYRTYRLTVKDRLTYGAAGLGIAAAISFSFYRSFLLFLVFGPAAALLLPVLMKKKLREKRRQKLLSEFLQALSVLSGYMSAGLSVENAMKETSLQLEKLLGKKSLMARECAAMVKGISVNEKTSDLFRDLGERSGDPEIRNFAEVFSLAEHSGGSTAKIIARTSGILREKAAVNEEIRTQTAARRYEQKLMNVMPFGIIGYLSAASPGFLDVMYETAAGRILMTLCLLLCLGAWVLSDRLMDIET